MAKRVEGDGLFLIDDVAIIVEVKAKSVAKQARRGDVRRLASDLKATIGEANDQATRLRRLIEANEGLWLGPDKWQDLSHIREVRSVIVLLDDVGPIGVAIGDLQAAGLLAERRPPWVVSLHDLTVVADICDRPSEFLLYLRRRTDSGIATFYRGADELDLYMLFLDGRLYVHDDPDEVRRAPASVPSAKKGHRRRYQASARRTMVVDHCQPLNEWFLRDRFPDFEPQPLKPTFNISQEIVPIIDAIADRGSPGWLRCTTDLLDLAGGAQMQLMDKVRECRRRTSTDGTYHDTLVSSAAVSGHYAMFVGTPPTSADTPECRVRLFGYMKVKSYQLQADRAYGMLFDTAGALVEFIYLTRPPSSDPELDRLIVEMGLQPVGKAGRPIPPSARRSTIRLRGKSKPRSK